jgi:hypothetical protein
MFLSVQLKNREEFGPDRTDADAIITHQRDAQPRLLATTARSYVSFFNSRPIVKAKSGDYKCYLKKM